MRSNAASPAAYNLLRTTAFAAVLVVSLLACGCAEFPDRPVDPLAGSAGGDPSGLDAGGDTGADTGADTLEDPGVDQGLDLPRDAESDAEDLGVDLSDDVSGDPGSDFDGPGPGGACRSHEECNDRRWCNGIEYCVAINGAPQGVCTVGVPEDPDDGIPCTIDRCVECDPDEAECEPGLSGRIENLPGDDCSCQSDADCEDAACGVGDCVEGLCEVVVVDEGTPCAHECGQPGVCRTGECIPRAEGPIQSSLCRDGADNDCDGNADFGLGCNQASEVTVVALSNRGPVGIDAAGVPLEVSAWTTGPRRMPAQEENLYCTARRLVHHSPFSSLLEFDDPLVNTADGEAPGNTITMGVQGSLQGRGMLLCDGRGVVLGPFAFEDPRSSLRVSINVGLPADRNKWAPADHQLVIGYGTPSTQGENGEDYAAAAAWSGSPITFGDSPVDFIIESSSGGGPAYVRIQSMSLPNAPSRTGCFWIDNVTISSIRNTTGGEGLFPIWDGRDAEEDFEARSPEDLIPVWRFTGGTHTLDVSLGASLVGNRGFGWQFSEVDWAGVSTPLITSGPLRLQRSVPLVFQVGMAVETPVATRPTSVGLVVQGAGIDPRKVAGATLNGQIPWLANLANFERPLRHEHLHRLVLPEAAKTLLSLELLFVMRELEDPAGRVLIDEVSLFFHDEDRRDTEVSPQASNPEDTVYRFAVRGRTPGRYEVQCHWQVPLASQYPTVSSSPVVVTLQ